MGKTLLIVLTAFAAVALSLSSGRAQSMSDDAKKRAFIESRRAPSSSAAPSARATPTPARSRPAASTSPKSTQQRVPAKSSSSRDKKKRTTKPKVAPKKSSSTPSRRSSASPTPRATPRATPQPTPTAQTPTDSFLDDAPPEATPQATPAPREPSRRHPRRTHRQPRSPHGSIPAPVAPVVITKSGLQQEEEYLPPQKPERRGWFSRGPKYKYLTPQVRKSIDGARIRKGRWVNIVVHNSGTRQGSAKAFDYYHRKVRKMENGLAYHFVIGNGTSTGNGEIEIGNRWVRQINGGHVRSNRLNDISLGICFVGDFNRDRPKKEQLESLKELITYLRKRVGKTHGKYPRVETHKGINPTPTSCPGNRFPYQWFYREFGKR